jgi:hypothetical protein
MPANLLALSLGFRAIRLYATKVPKRSIDLLRNFFGLFSAGCDLHSHSSISKSLFDRDLLVNLGDIDTLAAPEGVEAEVNGCRYGIVTQHKENRAHV